MTVPHAAARVILFGHHFNPFLSAQIGYTRPIRWVTYNNLNGSIEGRSVRMAIGDVSLKAQVPITTRTSLYGEGGMAIVSRTGFTVNDTTAMTSTTFVSPMFGGGVEYAVNPRWDLVAGAFYVPENTDHKQPGIVFGSAGFRYNLRALPEEQVTAARESGNIFPANLIQLSFITNGIGYGVNDAVSGKVPIFWGGEVEVAHGGAVRYQRNLWHSESHVSIDVGASATLMKSNLNRENLFALSVYPLLRWTFLRTTQADVSLSYSAAGPTLLSKQFLDGQNLGGRFTFQDLLGVGVFFGKHRDYYLQFDISHYSNGNMAAPNPGVKVPTTITIGRGF